MAASAVLPRPFLGGVVYRWGFVCVCLAVVLCSPGVESAAKDEALYKTTYLNETVDIHAPGADDHYRDKLVLEQLKIVIESVKGTVVHYTLPMDTFHGNRIVNPSGLDASVSGSVVSGPGIVKNSIQVNGRENYIRVTGAGHRSECFGDLDRCSLGYTLAFWVKFDRPITDGEHVYLSNGGHHERSHGVAMLYNRGNMEFRFRKKNGQEWRAKSNNILPGRWYHVLATWGSTQGLMLYVNGDLVDTNISPVVRRPLIGNTTEFNDFLIGRPNDNQYSADRRRPMSVDEFNFWSEFKTPEEVREAGPMYRYYLPMNSRPGLQMEDGNLKVAVGGNPSIVKGKISRALEFNGRGDFISGDDQSTTCLGDLTLCRYGILIGMWVRFDELHDSYILSTGNKGVKLYLRDGRLVAEAQQGDNFWQTYWSAPEANRWYFIEFAWNPSDGLGLYADLKQVARASSSRRFEQRGGNSHLNIGKSGLNYDGEKYASMVMDDLEMWYGDRSQLINLEFISRGRPQMQYLNMDAISYNRVSHPDITIDAYGQPRIVDGKIGGALNLDGNSQFVSLGNQHESCLGNLDLCRHGLLLSTWIRPGQLREGMEIFSSGANGINAWYSGGRLHVSARTLTREWTLQTDKLTGNQWQFVEFEWDPTEGLLVYINEQLAAQNSQPTVRLTSESTGVHPDREKFYIGRGDGSRSNARYANMTIDDLEYWYNNRRYLLAFDYIQRGKPERFHFDMDAIRDNKLVHPSLTIPVNGNPVIVPGKVNGAIRLDGNRQYVDIGDFTKACLGNMEHCNHGLTGSMWVNFRSLNENAYYLSSGGGLRIYHSGGKLWIVLERSGKRWEVGVPNLKTDDWYFLEYSWHPEKGLQVYVNNKLMGEAKQGTTVTSSTSSGRVLIGSANSGDVAGGRFRYGDAVIDEVETWYRDRENLIAFNHLLRDNITHIMFPLESQRGNRITHPDYTIIMYNGAVLAPGKVGNGVDLGGSGEYVTFGDQQQSCMGNLEMCRRGLTMSMYLNPRSLPNNGYIMSAGPYSIYSRDGKIYAKFTYGTKTWMVETNKIRLNNWQKLEVSWDEQKGLQLYVNQEKVASTTDYQVLPAPPRVTDHTVYLGRPNDDHTDGSYANAKIDELEFWYANREDLLKDDDNIKNLILDMSNITNGILVHPGTTIYIHGGRIISGYSGNAVLLNGRNQYIDVGGREVLCAGDLENCQKGFTLRFKISPNQLVDNTYFVSSAPVDVFYQNNRLVAEVRTPRYVWRTSTGNIRPNAWHQVELSWHPIDGLVMYVNSERVDQQTTASQNYAEYVIDKRFYLGRANTDMRWEYYADAVFDDLQIFEAKRDYLISIGVINPDTDSVIGWRTTVRPRTTTVATRNPRPTVTIPSIPDFRKRLLFDGEAWVVYDFDRLPQNYLGRSDQESLVIKFQTSHPEGLLWYTGDEDNNMHLTVKDGFLYLVTMLDRGQLTDRVRIASSRLDDSVWHDVVLTRRGQQVFIEVDGKQYPAHRLNYDFSLVQPARVYLGGSDRTSEITNYHITSNFYGKIREAILSGNGLPGTLDLKGLSLLRPRHILVDLNGNVVVEDDEDERPSPRPPGRKPVTFITKHAHLRLPHWDAAHSGTLEFNFQTAEPNGLILFSGGAGGRKDFIAVELYDGLVFLIMDMGNGVQRFPFGTINHKVDDDQPHYVRIDRDQRNLRLTLDSDERRHPIHGSDFSLDLGQVLYFGGMDHQARLPWHVWTGDAAGDAIGEDRKFFRGCLWDFKMNGGEPIDLEAYAEQQSVTGVEFECKAAPTDCATNPCYNGTCTNRWDRYVCDCSKTHFTGKRCELRAPYLGFTGNEHLRINIQPTRRTHTNDISLRFRTPKGDGLLFGVSSKSSDAYLNVFLENGQIKLETNLGGNVRPVRLIVQCRYPLNDNRWHTVYIKRRAHYLESYVDECSKTTEELPGEGYGLNIDDILVGRMGENDSPKNSFVGYLQNFFFDQYKFFDYFLYGGQPADIRFGGNINATLVEGLLPIHSVSFRDNPNSFLVMSTLQVIGDTAIRLMFKTKERDGLLLYNGGLAGDFFAMELVNGILHVYANDGSGARVVTSSAPPLNNNEWHLVEIIQTEAKKFDIIVDQTYVSAMHLLESRNTLDLTERLYVGGIPDHLRPRIPSIVSSKKGFVGCLASFTVNGRLYNLLTDATTPSVYVTPGCTDLTGFCTPGICRHGGVCREAVNGFFCDCNMTSYVGRLCTEEAEGYRYGEQYGHGITIYNFREALNTNADQIALGFMTWNADGTLLRLDSTTTADFFEARLVNGNVVVMYDLGGGIRYLNETRRIFNDGNYHYLVFTRDGDDATLRIDDFPMIHHPSTDAGSVIFNGMVLAKIGGNLNERNQIIDYFNGIISSVYINGLRIIDLDVYHGDRHVWKHGDITIATHPFFVPRPPPPTSPPVVPTHIIPPVIPTGAPVVPTAVPTVIPPIIDPEKPDGGGGGGGAIWEGEEVVVVGPDGGEPVAQPIVGPPGGVGGAAVAEGARAAAVAGAMIGVLALASSIVWAFYKFKPGLIGAGGGSPALVISSPTSTTTPLLAAAGPAGGAGGAGGGGTVGMAGGGGAGAGGGSASGMAVKTVVVTGGAGGAGAGGGAAVGTGTGAASMSGGGGGAGGAGMVNLSEHFQSISSSTVATGGAGAGAGGGGGSGTMHRGIQTDYAALGGGGAGGGGAQDQTISRSTIFQQDIRNIYNVNQDGGYGTGQGMAQQGMGQGMGTMQAQSAGGGYAAGYGSSAQAVQQGYSTLASSSYAYDGAQGFGQNVVDGGYMGVSPQGQALGGQANLYEIQNMALGYSGFSQQELFNQQRLAHQRLMAASSAPGGGPVPNLMAAEEIRVDCAKLTTNGRYVVTGSIFGPPQVWDLKTGDLVRVMKGDDFSSTDLHLANGDTLLVGQVAEMEQINPTDPVAKNRLHHRKLQIWDFESGHPLDMRRNELCTASCMMNDGERMLLGRTDKYGKNTVVIIWDILGNEQLRQVTCDASVGFADYISYLNLSKDNRYVIAGFQNSHDHKANFITFDLSSSSAAAVSPKVMALDAQVEVTAILENHEAVTGTKGGELIIWSIRTGRELRQLVTPPSGTMSRRDVYSQPAHRGEVKDVVVSKDGQFLVSASADRTVKLWNLEQEKLVHTCVGHSDEVWCCTISNDNELLVSGSRDCTIRLWRAEDGFQVAAIDAGMDVFRVLLSNNKKTIVALADRAASRKLIMLKVVRTKMKGSSRATSPRWQDGSDVY